MFTEEDIENDSLIKEEVAQKLQTLGTRKQGQIMEYYRTLVEEDYGLSPGQDLADMLVRALNDEDFATRILNTEVSLKQARINSIREDDLEFVMDLREKFIDEDAEDKVGRFIDNYMDRISGGGALGLSVTDKRQSDEVSRAERLKKELREERIKLQTLKAELEQEGSSTGEVDTSVSEGGRKDINDLFSREEEAEEEEAVEEPEEEEEAHFGADIPTSVDVEEEDETEDDVPLDSEAGVDE